MEFSPTNTTIIVKDLTGNVPTACQKDLVQGVQQEKITGSPSTIIVLNSHRPQGQGFYLWRITAHCGGHLLKTVERCGDFLAKLDTCGDFLAYLEICEDCHANLNLNL